jgi:hypothetical protein
MYIRFMGCLQLHTLAFFCTEVVATLQQITIVAHGIKCEPEAP